jgi:hypothetical protein
LGVNPSDVPPDKRPKKEILAMQAGDRVRLSDGSVREIVTNPMDGVWLILKEIGGVDGDDEMVLVTEIDGPA